MLKRGGDNAIAQNTYLRNIKLINPHKSEKTTWNRM